MTTKPTTSDMTVEQILNDFGVAMILIRNDLAKADITSVELAGLVRKRGAEALAAIEAIRKADMEYVGEDEPIELIKSFGWMKFEAPEIYERFIANYKTLQSSRRQRMAERLNNTEEQVGAV